MIVALRDESSTAVCHSLPTFVHEWVRLPLYVWPKVEYESSVWGRAKDTRTLNVQSRDLAETVVWAGRTKGG